MPELVILSKTQPEHLCRRLPRAPSDQPNQQRTESLTLLFEESLLSSSFSWPPWDSLCPALPILWAEQGLGFSVSGWVYHGRWHKEQFATLPKDQSHHSWLSGNLRRKSQSVTYQRIYCWTRFLSLCLVWVVLPNFKPLKVKFLCNQQKKDGHLQSMLPPVPKYMPKTGRKMAFQLCWHPLQILQRNSEGSVWTRKMSIF